MSDLTTVSTIFKQCSLKEDCEHFGQQGWLPATVEYFYFRKGKPRAVCKKCHARQVTLTQDPVRKAAVCAVYAKTHPEIQRKKKENFKQNHPEKTNEYTREWYARNAEEQRERAANYKNEHREQVLETGRKYKKAHLKQNNMHTLKYQARKKNLPDTLTLEEWEYTLAYFNNCCAVCGRPEGDGYHIVMDHWLPLSSDQCTGTTRFNAIPLCHSRTKGVYGACNNSKLATLPEKWLKKKFGEEFANKKMLEIKTYFQHLQELDEVVSSSEV